MADLERDLAAGTLGPIYLLYAVDPLLVERAVARLREVAVPEALRAFNYDVFDGRGGNAANIVSAARTLPMLGARRMVLVRDLPALAAAEQAALVPYLEAPNPTTVLVGVCGKVDKRLKLFATASKRGWLHELVVPKNLAGWVADEAKRRGIRITSAAVGRLPDVAGKDLGRLAHALEQLALYCGGRAIEADDVDDLIADTRERTVFELTDAIGDADRRRALVAVAALFEQRESPVGVIAMLARHVRQLALVHSGLRERMGPAELAAEVGVPPFVVDKLARQARRFSPTALDRGLVLLADADRTLKGQRAMMKTLGKGLGERIVLDRLVTRMIDLAGTARR